MSLKLNRFSLIAALSISAATTAAAHAASEVEIAVLESANPHSVDFASRDTGSRLPTKDELEWLEVGNPHSVKYANRRVSAATNQELRSLETGNPDAVK
jgi:hypothetical protein